MNNVIWKFNIDGDEVKHQLPLGAKILSAQVQHMAVVMWVLCNSKETVFEERTFKAYCTGEPITDDNLEFVDTVQMDRGDFILHIFEVK